MTALLSIDDIRKLNSSAPFNRWAEFEAIEAKDGQAELALRWRDDLGQYSGFLHAGLLGALVDTACGFAATTVSGHVLASHFAVNCLAPATGDRFIALAKVVKAGRRQVFTSAEVYALSSNGRKLVATGEAIMVPID